MEDKLKRLRMTFDQALFHEDHFTEKNMKQVKERMERHIKRRFFNPFQMLTIWYKPILGVVVCLVLLIGTLFIVYQQGGRDLSSPKEQSVKDMGDALKTIATYGSGAPGTHGSDVRYTEEQVQKVSLAVARIKASMNTYLPTLGYSDDYLMEVRIDQKQKLVQLVYPHFSVKLSAKAIQPMKKDMVKYPAEVKQGKGTWLTDDSGIEALQIHLNNTFIQIDSSKMVNPYKFIDIANSLTLIDQVVKNQKQQSTMLIEKYPNVPISVFKAMGESLGKKPEDLTEEDLLKVTELYLPIDEVNVEGEYDLSIIEKMKNLTSLALFVSYKDPSFLNGLSKLKSLSIQKPNPAKLPDFKSLPALETLELTEGSIDDLNFLKDLPHLKVLNLQNNHIEGLKDVVGLKHLETLNVRGNALVGLDPIKNLAALKNLDVSENQITSLHPIASLKQLTILSARDNVIRSTAPLNGLLNLQVVDLDNNPVSSLDFLKGNKELDTLLIQGTNISDMTVLKNMQKLRLLDIRRSKVNSVAILKSLPGLQVLELDKNQVKDWKTLENNKNLVITEDTYLG